MADARDAARLIGAAAENKAYRALTGIELPLCGLRCLDNRCGLLADHGGDCVPRMDFEHG